MIIHELHSEEYCKNPASLIQQRIPHRASDADWFLRAVISNVLHWRIARAMMSERVVATSLKRILEIGSLRSAFSETQDDTVYGDGQSK